MPESAAPHTEGITAMSDFAWTITITYEDGSSIQGGCDVMYKIGDEIMALSTREEKGVAIKTIHIE